MLLSKSLWELLAPEESNTPALDMSAPVIWMSMGMYTLARVCVTVHAFVCKREWHILVNLLCGWLRELAVLKATTKEV
eukprot:1158274-Pelagomonas_calceolata.AAC.9